MRNSISNLVLQILDDGPATREKILSRLVELTRQDRDEVTNAMDIALSIYNKKLKIRQLADGSYISLVRHADPSEMFNAVEEGFKVARTKKPVDDINMGDVFYGMPLRPQNPITPENEDFKNACWELSKKLQKQGIRWRPRGVIYTY